MKILKSFNNLESKGLFFFNLGIIFLPSAFPIGALLILFALVISIVKNKQLFFKDRFNYPLLICIGLFITSSINNSINFPRIINKDLIGLTYSQNEYISNIWIDLFNWIPFLIAFWGFQFYLNTDKKRFLCSKAIIIGTIPVLISCIGQYWLGWNEKLSVFYGLIVWYQKDIEMMSGLFSNPNYAGLWLSMAWPFSYFLVFKSNQNRLKIIITFLISITILYVTIMTNSRNALVSILISCIFLVGKKFLLLGLLIISLIVLFYYLANLILPFEIINPITEYLPKSLIRKFVKFDITSNLARIDLWKISIQAIFAKPIFGWGAGTFAYLYIIYEGLYKDLGPTHSHNFFLELSYNYGLPLALILTFFVANLFWRVLKNKSNHIFKNNNIDRTWFTSSVVLIIFSLSDMPYYDGKISLIFWILLSGLKCVGDDIKFT